MRPVATGVAIMIVDLLKCEVDRKFEILTCCVAFCGEIIWIYVIDALLLLLCHANA